MATTITIPSGDTAPDIVATLSNASGVQDLSGATVTLRLRLQGTSTRLSLSCTVDSPGSGGTVRHVRVSGDNLVRGTYEAEFHVVFAGGAVQTFPSAEANTIVVRDPIPVP